MATRSKDETSIALAPTTDASTVIDRGTLTTAEVIERTRKIREVMEAVMKPNVHYGVIPGTSKPTMYQPGADVLAVTFRIAPTIAHVEDLCAHDEVRYRVLVRGVHQVTDEMLAEGTGSCSSNEEKYRWRKPVCDAEWEETDSDRRRNKWAKGQGGKAYQTKQIRTSPVDVENTVLKMAVKRAKIAMILNATAASDVFSQDLEDLSDELRESLSDETSAATSTPVQQPQRKATPPAATVDPENEAGFKRIVEQQSGAAPVGVVIGNLERRRSQTSGTNYWIVRDNAGGIYFCPETGENWQVLVEALNVAEVNMTRVVLTTTTPEGQKYPTITAITPVASEPPA